MTGWSAVDYYIRSRLGKSTEVQEQKSEEFIDLAEPVPMKAMQTALLSMRKGERATFYADADCKPPFTCQLVEKARYLQ